MKCGRPTSLDGDLLSLRRFAADATICVSRGSLRLSCAADGLDDQTRRDVRIGVRVGPTVLDVALFVLRDLPRDTDRGPAVAHAVAELLVRAGLVQAREALLDAEAVVRDVKVVPRAERFGRGDARVVVAAHLVRREVRMRSRAVPVAADRLRIERGADAERLADAVQEPAREPQLVADLGRAQRPDLEFPLPGHDLGVDARYLEPGLEARVEMRFDDLTAEHLVRADAAVIPALWRGEPTVREAERPRATEERVLLLDPEPRVEGRETLGHLGIRSPHVRGMRLATDEHDLAQDEQIVAPADGIRTGEDGLEDAVRAVARCLLRARTVETPDGRLLALRHDLGLRTHLLRRLGPVDPDVLGPISAHGSPFSRDCSEARLTTRLYRIPRRGDDRWPNPVGLLGA